VLQVLLGQIRIGPCGEEARPLVLRLLVAALDEIVGTATSAILPSFGPVSNWL
jgi:hypothetical protein